MAELEDVINESQTGIVVEKVEDTNAGVLEISDTEENTFVINSIEDLVFFAYDVKQGNTYEGKTVKLGLSLDFNSSKSYVDPFRTDFNQYGYNGELKTVLTSGEGFKSIGITTEDNKEKSFVGIFDGNNYFINNMYFYVSNKGTEVNFEKRGLFANNYGIICNLKLININLYLNTDNGQLGGIAGQNSRTGNIEGCIVSGIIKNESDKGSVGGITTYSSGSITNCGNISNVYLCGSSSSACAIAGICSANGSNVIQNCYNSGRIEGKNEMGILYVGGIMASTSSSGDISNCYNTGYISGKAQTLRIGGIVGYNFNSVNNCYNIGKIVGEAETELNIGMIIGRNFNSTSTCNNSYYVKTDEIQGVGNIPDMENMEKSESEMKKDNFIEVLNNNNLNNWKKDSKSINNGYPILNWQ